MFYIISVLLMLSTTVSAAEKPGLARFQGVYNLALSEECPFRSAEVIVNGSLDSSITEGTIVLRKSNGQIQVEHIFSGKFVQNDLNQNLVYKFEGGQFLYPFSSLPSVNHKSITYLSKANSKIFRRDIDIQLLPEDNGIYSIAIFARSTVIHSADPLATIDQDFNCQAIIK